MCRKMKRALLCLTLLLTATLAYGQVPGMFQPLLSGPIIPKIITYQTNAVLNSPATTFTFSSQAIGTAQANRYVIVGVGGSNSTRTVSTVTIGGISATQLVQQQSGIITSALFIANVPTGTTASIVVTWSGSQDRAGIGVWSATGLSSTSANSTGSTTTNNGTITLTTLSGGFAVGFTTQDNFGSTFTWTNLTSSFSSASAPAIGGAIATTVGGSLGVSNSVSAGSTTWSTVAAAF